MKRVVSLLKTSLVDVLGVVVDLLGRRVLVFELLALLRRSSANT